MLKNHFAHTVHAAFRLELGTPIYLLHAFSRVYGRRSRMAMEIQIILTVGGITPSPLLLRREHFYRGANSFETTSDA